jgi:hypothetical protein
LHDSERKEKKISFIKRIATRFTKVWGGLELEK